MGRDCLQSPSSRYTKERSIHVSLTTTRSASFSASRKKNYDIFQCLKSLGAMTTNDEKTEYKIDMNGMEYGPHTFPSLKAKFTSMAQQMGWRLSFLEDA